MSAEHPPYVTSLRTRRGEIRVPEAVPWDNRIGSYSCLACGVPFAAGDVTILVPLGPGANESDRQSGKRGHYYNATAVLIHHACSDFS